MSDNETCEEGARQESNARISEDGESGEGRRTVCENINTEWSRKVSIVRRRVKKNWVEFLSCVLLQILSYHCYVFSIQNFQNFGC